jgi:uracil-DNA glycosylase family 4
MGFWSSGTKQNKNGIPSVDLLHRLECRACPLDRITANFNPHMKPTGSKEPLVYILGEAPGKDEDEEGVQFIGKSGQLLRGCIPSDFEDDLRWNNIVRTRPPGNDLSENKIAIECCRPSIVRDIEKTKPKAIFGFGNYPLAWATNQNGISKWRGRKLPVQVGTHTCWYFAFSHPAHLLRMRREWHGRVTPSELERAFQFDMRRAFDAVRSLPEPRVISAAEAESNVEIVECTSAGLDRLEQLMKWAEAQNSVGFDWETYPLRPYDREAALLIAGIGTEKLSFSYGIAHPEAKWTKPQRAHVMRLTKHFLLSQVRKVVHNLKFEQEWGAYNFGYEILRSSPWEDTYQQAAVLDERFGDTKPGCLSLEFLVQQYFGFNLKRLSNVSKKDLRKEPLREVMTYNAMDAKFHHMLWLAQKEPIADAGLQKVYEFDLRKIPTIVLTQIKGVRITEEVTQGLIKKYTARVKVAEKKIAAMPEVEKYERMFKETFNPGSNKQMGVMLLKVLKSKEGLQENGSYTVDETVLSKVDSPLAEWELKRRKAAKVLSTYILPYTDLPDVGCMWPDGKIHTNLNQPGTVSNRTSSEEPNTQNMPKRNEETKEVRKQIRAPKGHLIASFDHGQIQFRGIGMASQDKTLVKYLWDRHDIHGEWAERLSRAYPQTVGGKQNFTDKKIMKAFRHTAKNQWVFPLCFGSDLRARSQQLEIPENILKPEWNEFWRIFGGVKDWQDRLKKEYDREGIVCHLDGRLNRAPLSFNQMINYPIQGVEAHIVMDGYCRVSERMTRTGDWNFQPNLEVHDDLTFILPEKKIDYYAEHIITDMLSTDFDYINVPLTVEMSVGTDLYKMEEILAVSNDEWFK